MSAVIEELGPWWGQLSPVGGGAFRAAGDPGPEPARDPEPDETAAHEDRSLSFALTADSVVLSGVLPRLEGEAVIAAIEAFAERLRSEADHVPASARRADGLVALVNAAHASGSIPTRGGLPVSVSVTLDSTALGRSGVDDVPRAHPHRRRATLQRVRRPDHPDRGRRGTVPGHRRGVPGRRATGPVARTAPTWGTAASPRQRLGSPPWPRPCSATRIPLAVGRTARTATPAQRRALAARDRGCIIPGCGIPAEACQTHHVEDWAAGGDTDLPNLALLCWAHHRQVDLGMWTIVAATEEDRVPRPEPGAPPGTPWPANHSAPWTITRTPRTRWRQ